MGKRVITRREVAMIRWEFGGFEFSFDDLARLSRIPVDALQQRLMRGWNAERAVTTPVRGHPEPERLSVPVQREWRLSP